MPVTSWPQRYMIALLAAALLLLGAGLVVARLADNSPDGVEFAYGSGLPDGSPIRVQVAGAVASPGVYGLRAGDRVLDALAAAGGPAEDADLDDLNLARRVRDEERIDVPRLAGPAPGGDGTALAGGKININTATEKQLDGLPGIGEAYSRRIVDSRKVDGPYKSTQDLVERKVIPAATFEQIRDLITTGP